MTGDLLLVSIVNRISEAIEEETNFDRRRKLKDARNLVRDVLWGTGEAARRISDAEEGATE